MGASEDRIANKVAAKITAKLAADVASSLDSKLDELHERQAVQGQKIDFLCTSFAEDRVERKEACENHKKWTKSIQDVTDDYTAKKNMAIGAAKIGTIIGTILGASIVAKWKHWLGF